MDFYIAFNNSGDTIPFETLNHGTAELLEFYLDRVNQDNFNNFIPYNDFGSTMSQHIQGLRETIVESNSWIYELIDGVLPVAQDDDYLDQDVLNNSHADWVMSQGLEYNIAEKRALYNSPQTEAIHHMFPDEIPVTTLGTLFKHLGKAKSYGMINLYIHDIEIAFDDLMYQCAATDWFQVDNPFSKSLLTNDICNFKLSFNHLGRTLYNKFIHRDSDLKYSDENTFNELLGFVTVSLARPQTIGLSPEYVAWCDHHNREPSGDNLNIGNIPDLETRLTDYRRIVFRNAIKYNSFTIQIGKG